MPRKTTAKATEKETEKRTTGPARKRTAATASLSKQNVIETAPETAPRKTFKIKKSTVIIALIIVVLGAGVYYFRGLFIAAIVNGQPIPRYSVIMDAEKQAGKQALQTLTRNALIEQEAAKQHVTVSDKEINDQIKTIESNLSKQGQKLDQVLQTQGMTRDDLKKLVRLDKIVGKIAGKDVTVSDKEVDDYISKNADLLNKDMKPEEQKKQVKETLKQQKLNQKVQTWLQDLQAKAKIIYFVNY